MIKAVICDHGGVLSTREEAAGALDRWRSQLGLDSESFKNALFDRNLGDQMAIGAVTQEDGSKLIAHRLGIDLPTLERLREECWSPPIINAQLIEFLESLKPAVKVACLTNWSLEARAVMEKRGVAQVFDLIVVSAEEGLAKPNPRIFEVTLDRLGVSASEAVVIDDSMANVEAARSLGLEAVLFEDTDRAILELRLAIEPLTRLSTTKDHDPKEIVRQGYNQISHAYRGDEAKPGTNYPRWAADVVPLLPPGGRVLDLGCGNGIPTSQIFLKEGFSVTGVDLSEVQIERARVLLPAGQWIVADMADVQFERNTFDAIVSLFAIIHVPIEEQPQLFDKIAIWLKPGGYLLVSVGWKAWTGTEDFYGAPMYWSHEDADTYKNWLEDRAFELIKEEFVPEGSGGHTVLLAHKSA